MELEIPTAEVFEPLLHPARFKAAHGGRGSGKSHFFAGAMVEAALLKPGFRGVCLREVQKSLKESAKLLIEDKIREFGLTGFRCLKDETITPGGGLIIYRGMNDLNADTIKSLEGFDVSWFEEAQTMTARSLELLRPTMRAKGSELWFSWNPRNASDPVEQFLRGPDTPNNAVVVEANYSDNPWFPDELETERAHDEAHNRDRYGHIWLGHYEPQVKGAIWDRALIQRQRVTEAPTLSRIVVAIDPAVSSEAGSNEHGVIVAGLGSDGHAYVLEDGTLGGPPERWARRAASLFDKWEADAIVVEINQGGDMVKHTLRSVRPDLPVKEVRATRGKHVRAEPISAQYEVGNVHHVGDFPELEDQMCQITAAGYEGEGSPDRADAMVWALTDLFPRLVRKEEPPRRKIIRGSAGGWMG
jgi:hypothetical protein